VNDDILKDLLSPKQYDVVTLQLKDFNILVGKTGSGKSYGANLKAYYTLNTLPKGSSVIFTGNTNESLYKNVIKELLNIDAGIGSLRYTSNPARITTTRNVEVFCIGMNSEGADKRTQGGSVDFMYMDEPTTYPKSGYDMLLTRCRKELDGKLVMSPILMTLNPDDEENHVKHTIDSRGDDTRLWNFDFWDNKIMSQEWIDKQSKLYTGEFHDRMIKGTWTGGKDKRIVPEFDDRHIKKWKEPIEFEPIGALDPGFQDFTAYCVGYYDFLKAKIVVKGEFIIRGASTPEIAEGIKAINKKVFPNHHVGTIWSDTSSQLIYDLRTLHELPVQPTMKDDKDAQLNYLRTLFVQDKIVIDPDCKTGIRHLRAGKWNKKRTSYERSDELGHYDFIDACVYFARNLDTNTNPYPYDFNFDVTTQRVPAHMLNGGEDQALTELASAFK